MIVMYWNMLKLDTTARKLSIQAMKTCWRCQNMTANFYSMIACIRHTGEHDTILCHAKKASRFLCHVTVALS